MPPVLSAQASAFILQEHVELQLWPDAAAPPATPPSQYSSCGSDTTAPQGLGQPEASGGHSGQTSQYNSMQLSSQGSAKQRACPGLCRQQQHLLKNTPGHWVAKAKQIAYSDNKPCRVSSQQSTTGDGRNSNQGFQETLREQECLQICSSCTMACFSNVVRVKAPLAFCSCQPSSQPNRVLHYKWQHLLSSAPTDKHTHTHTQKHPTG
jgi:hypothetical protein